jgi:WD40 repeat protein
MISAITRRWSRLRPRSRVVYVLLATTALWATVRPVIRWWGDTWPARVVLKDPMCASPLAFSPDGRTFLTYGGSGITTWDVASGRKGETWAFNAGGHPEMGTFSPDGKTYAAGVFAYPGPLSIDLFDTATGQTKASFATARRAIMHLAFAPDGRTLRAFLGDDPQSKACSSWNPGYAADLHEVVTLDTATGLQVSSRQLTTPTRGAITAITPDGRIMAIADRKKTAQLWDLDSDESLGNLPTTSATIYIAMGFSDDGQTLAIGRMDGTIDLWDVPGLRLVKTLRGNTGKFTFTMIRFSPDGRTLAPTGYRWGDVSAVRRAQDEIRRALGLRQVIDPEIILLDIATGRRLAGAADSTCPLYSPDGRVLATGEPDGTTRLRDIAGP